MDRISPLCSSKRLLVKVTIYNIFPRFAIIRELWIRETQKFIRLIRAAWLAWSFFRELQDGWLRECSRTHSSREGQEEDCRGPSIHDRGGEEGGRVTAAGAATTREMSGIARAKKKKKNRHSTEGENSRRAATFRDAAVRISRWCPRKWWLPLEKLNFPLSVPLFAAGISFE